MKAIQVEGTLIIIDNTQGIDIEVETIYVAAKAVFKIGSSKRPIRSSTPVNITFRKLENEKGAIDKHVHKRGLISMGHIEIYGQNKTEYIQTKEDQYKDAESLNIAGINIENWRTHDEILLPSSVFVKK